MRVVTDNDVEVLVPPLHHQVVTATLRVDESRPLWMMHASRSRRRSPTSTGNSTRRPRGSGSRSPGGCRTSDRYVPEPRRQHVPVDRRASATRGHEVRVLEDAIRFPSDPDSTMLEVERRRRPLPQRLARAHRGRRARRSSTSSNGLFDVTSIRKGFVGGGFDGGHGLPKQMAHRRGHRRR